jgi:hypothetical protein
LSQKSPCSQSIMPRIKPERGGDDKPIQPAGTML